MTYVGLMPIRIFKLFLERGKLLIDVSPSKPMTRSVENIIKDSEKILPSEELLMEALRDIMKDEVKAYIREKMEEKPEIKESMRKSMLLYIEAKMKEVEAVTLMSKAMGELGLVSLPPEMKKEFIESMYKIFQKEIDEIIEKTV